MSTSLTPPNLVPASGIADVDLLTVWPSVAGGPLSKMTFAAFRSALTPGLSATYLQSANNLSDLANPTIARTNLGLGTAAIANVGTSGNTVPMLNTANSWSGAQTIALASPGTAVYGLYLQNTAPDQANNAVILELDTTGSMLGNGSFLISTRQSASTANLAFWVKQTSARALALNLGADLSATFQGPIFQPNMSSFCVRLSAALTGVTGNTSQITLVFNNKLWDLHNDFNTTTGQFTAPYAGVYMFDLRIEFSGLVAQNNRMNAMFVVNNTGNISYGQDFGTPHIDLNGRCAVQLHQPIKLNAGDVVFVEYMVQGNSSNNVGVLNDLGGGSSAPCTTFSGFQVG